QDAAYLNKKRTVHGEPAITPLFTRVDAEDAIRALTARAYEFWFDLHRARMRVTFLDAGHILGSAITIIHAREGNNLIRLGFTGDLGVKNKLILRDPQPAPLLDYLIMEGTYGDRVHEAVRDSETLLAEIVTQTTERGGKTIIPAFALDRTQEIVYSIHRSILKGII